MSEQTKLKKHLSPLGAFALAFGCAVGWGSFVMPGTTFLPIAGPLGTAVGILIGGLVMLIIGVNYHYLMNRHPDCGGTFTYARKELNYDHGLLSTWFLLLVYIAIIWANATAIPLICRNLFGNLFQVGPHYTVAGFDVYAGETLLSVAAVLVSGAVCILGGRFSALVQTLLALLLIGGIMICTITVFVKTGNHMFSIKPSFAPGGGTAANQIMQIVVLAPWAYVGFESISHSTEEFRFSTKKSIWILIAALAAGVVVYTCLAGSAAAVLPKGFGSWTQYLSKLSEQSGLAGLPTFYAVSRVLGDGGVVLLGLAAGAAIMTGLVGNTIAASRLLFSMGRDGLLPKPFFRLNKHAVPSGAILFVMAISVIIPFFGRTAISWIVDVNTIGATIAYIYTSYIAFRAAGKEKNTGVRITGAVGLVISVLFMIYFLIPNFWSTAALASESYLILVVWSILGFLFFRYLFRKDEQRRFGQSTVVWIVFLFLIFFVTMLWFREATKESTAEVLSNLNAYNVEELAEHGIVLDRAEAMDAQYFMEKQINQVNTTMQTNSVVQMAIILIALFIMFNIFHLISGRERSMEVQKMRAEESSKAKTVFLSNMSHDIRTPMNAIIGYTEIAKKTEGMPREGMEYLDKIESSSKHLLALINDILDMSRIESGKMDLEIVRSDLKKTMNEVYDLFSTQMKMKKITYTVDSENVEHPYVMCDSNRLNRVLLNLISNAYKFTPEGGSVSVRLKELKAEGGRGYYEIRVRDTGMGMTPEFSARVFEAYERDRTVSKIQGTGLGMAITKSIVDLMNGKIEVESEEGKGTEFILHLDFELTDSDAGTKEAEEKKSHARRDYSSMRILLAEDQVVNREIATMILQQYGFQLDYAENGKEAVDKIESSPAGTFQVVLMDIQMPEMNGYEAARAIRSLPDPEKATVPILAMSANAFAEDVRNAKESGMNGHVAKPIEIGKLLQSLNEVLPKE